jgi:cell surface protein SprA
MMKWYNLVNTVDVKSVYPLRDVQPGQDRLTPFYILFDPTTRGAYNYNALAFDTVNKKQNWNGIMKYLNSTSTDLINENISFIEFNMRIDNTISGINLTTAKVYVDLGSTISEDAIPNGQWDTEDKLGNPNGILEEAEDIGLDFMLAGDERTMWRNRNGRDMLTTDPNFDDPALDNNDNNSSVTNYNKINGTEANRFVEGFRRPDSEDLNRNGAMENYNKYFEYEISLDTNNNRRISGRGAPGSGWFQYRIPLSEFTKKIGDVTLNNIQYARLWVKGVDGQLQLLFVDFNLVGNQWFKPNRTDTTYSVSVVNIEENSQIYMSPVPGDILRQTVRNQNGVNTKSNEQSLVIGVSNLITGQQKTVVKDYRSQTLDLFNYKAMKLFVNGDPSFNYVNESIYDATMVIRFGSDSLNYYEYRAPIHPDVRPGSPWNAQNEVSIVFADLTSLKVTRDSANQVLDSPVPNGPPGSFYRVRGNPALNIIREFVLGVEKNRSGLNSVITGSVWFNEIRVLKVNDDNGYAFNVNTSMKIADLGNISFNAAKVDPNFHTLDTRVGSRQTGLNWDVGVSLNVHKIINNALSSFFSGEWKDFLNIPVTFRHAETVVDPKYYPGTDIEIDKAAEQTYKQVLAKTNDESLARTKSENIRIESQTLIVRNELSITGMSFKFPGNNYFVRTLLNAFSLNFTGVFGSQRDFTYERKNDLSMNGSLNFNTDFQLADKLNLKIGNLINLGEQYRDAKIYFFAPFLPLVPLFSNNITALVDFNRTRNDSKQRKFEDEDPISRLFRANRGFGFNWKFIENWIVDLNGTYSFKVGSDLSGFETDSAGQQQSGSKILDDIFLNNGLVNFGKDLDFTQTSTFNPKFNIPVMNKFMDVNMSYNVTYGWTNPNTTVNIGHNVGFSNTWNTGVTFKFSDMLSMIGVNKSGTKSGSGIRSFIGAGANGTSNGKLLKSSSDSTLSNKPNLNDILKIFGTFIPDLINLTFNQTNTLANQGVNGRPGFANFWLYWKAKEEYGPSRMYQLGFSDDPGKRVPNLNITDINNLTNNLTLNATLTPLIPQNIRMNLSYKSLWGYSNTGSFISTQEGLAGQFTNRNSNKTSGYSMFFSGKVEDLRYEPVQDPTVNSNNFAGLFKQKIASMPFPNWNLTISGLEKLPLFSEIATTVSFENTFTSEYSEASVVDVSNNEIVQRQSVTQSFNPLIGINVTFKQLWGGSMTAAIRFNSSKSNILAPSSNLVQTTNTNDWSINMNYAKAGFEIPFFGLSLKNDITFALTISKSTNDPKDYKFEPGTEIPILTPGNGSAVTTFNPSIQYSLSSKVQMTVFYKYISTEPTGGGVTVVPRTSNEGGLNFRISIGTN